MRDFERIELLIKEDEKLTAALFHECKRVWDIADAYEKVDMPIHRNIFISIGNSLIRILGEKTGYKPKEYFDELIKTEIDEITKKQKEKSVSHD